MLRHIIGFFVGIVLAPILPYAMGRAVLVASRTFAENFGPTGTTLLATGVLVVVGAVVGALTSMRWLSPVAALIVGVPMLALTAVHLASPGGAAAQLLPVGIFSLLQQGVLAVAGAILVVSALSPQRWRGKDKGVAPDPSYLQPPAMPQPAGGPDWGASAYAPPGGFTAPSGPPRPPEMPGDPPRP